MNKVISNIQCLLINTWECKQGGYARFTVKGTRLSFLFISFTEKVDGI
jgi:hypothetical protein